jgi:hypothetical protein
MSSKSVKEYFGVWKARKILGITREPLEDDMANARILANIEQKVHELAKSYDYDDVDLLLTRGKGGQRFIDVVLKMDGDLSVGISAGEDRFRYQGEWSIDREKEHQGMEYKCRGELVKGPRGSCLKKYSITDDPDDPYLVAKEIGELLSKQMSMLELAW